MSGVPASVTSAMRAPACKRATNAGTRSRSLCSCSDSIELAGRAIPQPSSSMRVCRVSSASSRSASRRQAAARGLRSCRLPMGVATTYSAPAGFRPVESVALSVTLASQGSRMLHVSPQGGQARRTSRWASWVASSLILLVLAAAVAHAQDTAPTLAQADALARDGQHLEAAARYEQLARRGFMTWDATTALLAAREYVVGGAVGDAQRLLDKVRNRVKTDDERALLVEVEARVALERGDAARALGSLRTLPQPWPAESAPDLLELRGRAEIATGDPAQWRTNVRGTRGPAGVACSACRKRSPAVRPAAAPAAGSGHGRRGVRTRARLARIAGHRDGRRQRCCARSDGN